MGLASALSTALTGLTAAETTIDVVGNNLANSNTVGFKASEVAFATQFLQTLSLGSAPTPSSGGTNPRQKGLGTMVADITPNFSQGTIEISSNPTDLAIQGDGFFIVQGNAGEQLYTRNGIFKLSANNEMISITGNRLLGYGIDDQFQIQTTNLVPVEIPLGSAAVAQATANVYLEGTLSPTGDIADTAEVIQTGILGDTQYTNPGTLPANSLETAQAPSVGASTATLQASAVGLPDGDYRYRIVYADSASGVEPDTEGMISADIDNPLTAAPGNRQILLDNLPNDPDYSSFRVYRSFNLGDYEYIGERSYAGGPVTSFLDTGLAAGAAYDSSSINGNYSYYVTFTDTLGGPSAGGLESRPSAAVGPLNMTAAGRLHLKNLPTDASGTWVGRRIYRNTAADSAHFYYVGEVPGVGAADCSTFTDNVSDAVISDPTNPDYRQIDMDGPKINTNTLLTEITCRDNDTYYQPFEEGTLSFSGRKGGRSLAAKEMEVTSTSTVLDLIDFMEQAMGIQSAPGPDPLHPIPFDASGANPGGIVTTDGQIRLVGNNGEANAIEIGLSGMQLTTATATDNVNLPFNSIQSAVGESAVADFIAYDSLGIPLEARLTMVLESRDSTSTTYRWFADSPDNDSAIGVDIAVGTGLISFDGEGNFTDATEATVSIDRRNVSSASPLEFDLDFSQLSGLATDNSTLAVSRQDGSGPGVLTSFIVGEDGRIRGVFSNGMTRDLGQIRLARFSNPTGLEQKGQNLYSTGVNSGLPVQGDPGEQGIGTIIAGAQELSNTDIGSNLIDLILASTMYRGNTRVITTAQQMLDELLALRR